MSGKRKCIDVAQPQIPFESNTMWSVSFVDDPLLPVLAGRKDSQRGLRRYATIAHAKIPVGDLIDDASVFAEGGRVARVAAADFIARRLTFGKEELVEACGGDFHYLLETLDKTKASLFRHHRKVRIDSTPLMLERTDIWCDADNIIHVFVRLNVYADENAMTDSDCPSTAEMEQATRTMLGRVLSEQGLALMKHVAIAVLQDRLRSTLGDLQAVAFVADGAILPRKSGASAAPMASPPAVPFRAPGNSPMNQAVRVEMGRLKAFLGELPKPSDVYKRNGCHEPSSTTVVLTGLVIPKGVSLIVGGGYHGKSTLLRCIAAGVFNKIPGDGREFSVTVDDAVTVRAEDGRFVNNCNVSAFISNLPTPPGISKALDTTHFSTGEASGSTSQAANVSEAIEMGASAFLVDEDVSAANFMARDGRMRSLVMDESITPLLYRVNGLYNAHGISSIVVVGGVGDWLDVPNAVILMDKYQCRDATAKAHSVSRQFSHGHVQYAGRGVVHRLPWDKSGTPVPRRPIDAFGGRFSRQSTAISLLDGNDALALHEMHHAQQEAMDDDEEEEFHIDMSRCEQLMGKKPQLYGCGLAALWLLEAARQHPGKGMPELLTMMDSWLDQEGFASVVGASNGASDCPAWKLLIETIGCAYRPRKFEVGQALTRLRGIQLEEIPLEDDGAEAAAKAEAERKKRELLELWNARRKNKINETE